MRPFRFGLVVAICVGTGAPALAQPAQVILIRHGEKPDDDTDTHLSTFGRSRAAALVPYFRETEHLLKFGPPAAVYAQKAPDPKKNSLRPIETVQPLADALKLTINHDTERDKYQKMVGEILTNERYKGKMVLICWEHHVLADIAPALLKHVKEVKGAPDKWEWPGKKHFDRTWVITYTGKDSATFHDRPQRLMFGDSDN